MPRLEYRSLGHAEGSSLHYSGSLLMHVRTHTNTQTQHNSHDMKSIHLTSFQFIRSPKLLATEIRNIFGAPPPRHAPKASAHTRGRMETQWLLWATSTMTGIWGWQKSQTWHYKDTLATVRVTIVHKVCVHACMCVHVFAGFNLLGGGKGGFSSKHSSFLPKFLLSCNLQQYHKESSCLPVNTDE